MVSPIRPWQHQPPPPPPPKRRRRRMPSDLEVKHMSRDEVLATLDEFREDCDHVIEDTGDGWGRCSKCDDDTFPMPPPTVPNRRRPARQPVSSWVPAVSAFVLGFVFGSGLSLTLVEVLR
jgi:hypothetical protein